MAETLRDILRSMMDTSVYYGPQHIRGLVRRIRAAERRRMKKRNGKGTSR